MKQLFKISFLLLISLSSCQAKKAEKQEVVKHAIQDSIDRAIFSSLKKMAIMASLDSLSTNVRAIEIAKMFLQTPYVGGTLDENNKEELVVNLHGLDCTTYLENVIALSSTFSNKKAGGSKFVNELETIRYRSGKLIDYSSRLHYFSDWIFENEQKGIVKDITVSVGGEKYDKNIDFMSTHVDSYSALKKNSSFVDKILETEKQINQRDMFYLPENRISENENKIQTGDIIAITTAIKGLDVSHTGMAIFVNDRLHLIHASSKSKKVVISEISLSEMLLGNKNQTGIIVARLQQEK